MISLQQQAYIQASKVAHYWLQRAAVLPTPDRVAFLQHVGSQVYPFFERDVNVAFLANMKKGMGEKLALQNALIGVLQGAIMQQTVGMGTDKTSGSIGTSAIIADWGDRAASWADTAFGIYSSVQEQRREDSQASWERTMAETAAEHQREMDRLNAEARARAAAAAASAPASAPQMILDTPPADNTGLYVALGIGAAALLGGALILTRKK